MPGNATYSTKTGPAGPLDPIPSWKGTSSSLRRRLPPLCPEVVSRGTKWYGRTHAAVRVICREQRRAQDLRKGLSFLSDLIDAKQKNRSLQKDENFAMCLKRRTVVLSNKEGSHRQHSTSTHSSSHGTCTFLHWKMRMCWARFSLVGCPVTVLWIVWCRWAAWSHDSPPVKVRHVKGAVDNEGCWVQHNPSAEQEARIKSWHGRRRHATEGGRRVMSTGPPKPVVLVGH